MSPRLPHGQGTVGVARFAQDAKDTDTAEVAVLVVRR